MALAAGTQLGPYRIVSPIGKGGMGEVYRAQDDRLEREVAIKVLPTELAEDPEALRRFEREAKALAALSHSNILSIYDVGHEDRVSYVVTELLEGDTLRTSLQNGALSPEKFVAISIAVAEGLGAAHSKGVIHWDLKPENIFLTADGHVKILDFGLARRFKTGASSTVSQLETATNVVAGSVPYMSPEQAMGDAVDSRTDIFSFGCVLYEMASGKRPFAGKSMAEILVALLQQDPPPLNEISHDLQQLIAHCLDKNRDHRFQSAVELANALKSLDTGASVTTVTRIPKKSHLLRWSLAILAFVIAALAYIFVPRPSGQIESIAVLPFANVTGDAETDYLTDGIPETIINRVSQLPNVKVVSRTAAFRYKGKEMDAGKIGRELNVQAVLVGRVQQRGENLSISTELIDTKDDTQLWGEQYNRKLSDILSLQDEIAREISENLKVKLTGSQRAKLAKPETTNSEAYQLYLKGRYHFYKFTEEGLTKSIPYFQQAIAKDPAYALAHSGLAGAYFVLGINYWPPADAFPKAKEEATKAAELDDAIGTVHNMLGVAKLFGDWDWEGARREFERALELNPSLADPHDLLAYYWLVTGNPEQGIQEVKKALELEPYGLVLNADFALALALSGRYDESIRQSRTTLEIDPQNPNVYLIMGIAYVEKGMYADAIVAIEKAKSIEQNSEILGRLGNAYARAGERTKALEVLNEFFLLASKKYMAPYGPAMIYCGLGQNEKALEWLEKAYRERTPWLIWIAVDPVFAPLHKEPRFQQILTNMNLRS